MSGRKHYYLFWPLALIIIMFLTSCKTNNQEQPNRLIPTKESLVTEIRQTVELPSASQALINPTGTMEPTLAYWATAQEESFDAERRKSIETKQAISTLVKQYPQMCGFQIEGVFLSPDREWIASDCKFDAGVFRVFQTHGDLVWEIPYAKIFPHYPEFVGGARTLYWSVDGKYLYFVTWACCPDIDSIGNGNDLYRLHLQKGDFELMITGNFNYYSFSPDDQKIAYTPNNQTDVDNSVAIHILDLITDEEVSIHVGDFEQAGIVTWKQDGTQLVLIAQNGSLYSDDRKFSLVFVDLSKKKSQTIIGFTEDVLYVTSWSEDNILTITRTKAIEYYGYYINISTIVFYDLKTNRFVTRTPNQ